MFAAVLPALAVGLHPLVLPDLELTSLATLALAFVAAAPLALGLRRSWFPLLLGIGLSSLGGVAMLRMQSALDGASLLSVHAPWTFFDLTREPLPPDPPLWLTARGHLHPTSALDEYDVPLGQRPDQSTPPQAVLVPLLGAPPDRVAPVASPGPILIARIPPSTLQDLSDAAAVTLQGRLRPIAPSILATLVDLEGDAPPAGYLLDTLAAPASRTAWLALAAALIATALACACFLAARTSAPPGQRP